PAWAALAQLCWRAFPREWRNPGIQPPVWHAVMAAWLMGLSLFLISNLLGYWYRQQMTREEGLSLLQDTVWKETRREQRRVNRWLAWARLRTSSAKERS